MPSRLHKGGRERTIVQAEKDREAALLRAEGWTYNQLGQRYEITTSAAWHMVRRAIADAPVEAVGMLRSVDAMKIDDLYGIARGHAVNRDPYVSLGGLDRCVKLLERRAKLFGLDAPIRTEVAITSTVESEIETLALEVGVVEGELVPQVLEIPQ